MKVIINICLETGEFLEKFNKVKNVDLELFYYSDKSLRNGASPATFIINLPPCSYHCWEGINDWFVA